MPAKQRADFRRIETEAARLFGAYIRGQLLLGVIVGTLSGIAYFVLGVPYAVLLGVLAGIFELVPIVGPVVAGAVAALVALTQPFPLVVWVVLAAIAIQQIENNLLVPRISGGAVGLHPLAALLAVLVGVEIAGVIGALFAVPLTGLAWSIYRARDRRRRRRRGAAALARDHRHDLSRRQSPALPCRCAATRSWRPVRLVAAACEPSAASTTMLNAASSSAFTSAIARRATSAAGTPFSEAIDRGLRGHVADRELAEAGAARAAVPGVAVVAGADDRRVPETARVLVRPAAGRDRRRDIAARDRAR